jgi:hypothetical protein
VTNVNQWYVFPRLYSRNGRMTGEWGGTGKDLKGAVCSLGYYVGIFWQSGKNLETSVRTDDDPAKTGKRFRPNVPYNSRASSPHKANRCLGVTNQNCPIVPYNSRGSPLHQASRCSHRNCVLHIPFSTTGREGCLLCHTFYTSKTNFNIILAPVQTFSKQVSTKIIHF